MKVNNTFCDIIKNKVIRYCEATGESYINHPLFWGFLQFRENLELYCYYSNNNPTKVFHIKKLEDSLMKFLSDMNSALLTDFKFQTFVNG